MSRGRRRTAAGLGLLSALAGLSGALLACRSLRALDPETKLAGRAVAEVVLRFAEPCVVLPGGTPMGRPDGVRSHVLAAGRYRPVFEDDAGVYFAGETGVSVTEPALRGTRSRAGGVYLLRDGSGAWEYLGDVERVSFRQALPRHCHFELQVGAGASD
jgi:hypothetical protein